MALEPCKVCGSLTSTNDDICMICEYPRKGRKSSAFFKGIAIALAIIIGLPLILVVIQQLIPSEPSPQTLPAETHAALTP